MQQPVNNTNDERFWTSFAECSHQLIADAKETDLPAGWWHLPLLRKAQALLKILPKSGSSQILVAASIPKVAICALLLCEEEPKDFGVLIHQRITAMRTLVEQKGQDYNAGGVSILEYWPEGLPNISQEIHKRTLRLLSIARSEQRPRFDEAPEIGLDIAAYSVFLLAYLETQN